MPNQIFSQKDEKDYNSGIGVQSAGLSPVVSGDKMYDQLYAANPYNNLTYNRSGWQALVSALGFRTDYDRWLEDAQVNAAEYNAQVAQMKQQNEFNSPEAQAARMREAGQNPDLLGTSGVVEASKPVQDVNGMQSNVGDEFMSQALPVISAFAGAVSSALSKGMAFASDILAFSGVQRDLDSKNLDNLKKVSEAADRYLSDKISAGDVSDPDTFQGRRNFLSNIGNGLKSSVAKDYGIPRRMRRAFERFVSDRSQSIVFENDVWKKAIERNKLRLEGAEQRASKRYSQEDKVIDAFVGPVVVARDEIYKITAQNDQTQENLRTGSLDVQSAKQDYEQAYYDELGSLDAGANKARSENSQYLDEWYQNRAKKVVHEASAKITENLQKEADSGNILAKGTLISWCITDMLDFGVGDIFKSVTKFFVP